MTSGKAWTVFSALVGFAALLLSIYSFVSSQEKTEKAMETTILSGSNLVDSDVRDHNKKIGLTYDGVDIPNLTLINLQILNSGGQPIRATDVEEPIRIHLSHIKEIVSARQIQSSPSDLNVSLHISNSSIVLETALLNPRDRLVISIYAVPETATGIASVEKVTARIAGLSSIQFYPQASQEHPKTAFRQIAIGILSTLLGVLFWWITSISRRFISKFEIVEARYGTLDKSIDVTENLRRLVGETHRNTLIVVASNEIAGDPVPRVRKMLRVRYRFFGKESEEVFREGALVKLP